jgi:hypothetical protein
VTEKLEHKIINSDQCLRCGGTNTESIGSDDTLVETRICRDCEAKDPNGDDCCYDVCLCEIVEAVRWTTDDGSDVGEEHEISDSHYLADVEALRLLADAEYIVHAADAVENLSELADDCPVEIVVTAKAIRDIKTHVARAKGESPDVDPMQVR